MEALADSLNAALQIALALGVLCLFALALAILVLFLLALVLTFVRSGPEAVLRLFRDARRDGPAV